MLPPRESLLEVSVVDRPVSRSLWTVTSSLEVKGGCDSGGDGESGGCLPPLHQGLYIPAQCPPVIMKPASVLREPER